MSVSVLCEVEIQHLNEEVLDEALCIFEEKEGWKPEIYVSGDRISIYAGTKAGGERILNRVKQYYLAVVAVRALQNQGYRQFRVVRAGEDIYVEAV